MEEEKINLTHHLTSKNSGIKFLLLVLSVALIAGTGTGYYLSSSSSGNKVASKLPLTNEAPKTAQQDTRTFRDFAEGKITKKPVVKNDNYTEGTHILIRDGAVPVTLTSSVVDLSQYENKKVKVYGETQKAVEEGWLMDVGKIEVIN